MPLGLASVVKLNSIPLARGKGVASGRVKESARGSLLQAIAAGKKLRKVEEKKVYIDIHNNLLL